MFKGKVALVTGGSRGIGRAIALKLAEQGADVAVIYSGNKEKAEAVCREAENCGVKAVAFQCNVSDYKAAEETVKKVSDTFGTIDILVNNAGITRDGLVLSMKEEDYDAVMDTNLKGAFNMIRHCSGIFLRKRSGKIINIASVSGLIGNPGQSNYAASKAGMIGLTKAVAKELAGRNVCCNAVAPGFIETDMTEALDKNNALMSQIPMKRMGTPEDVAELVAFLAGSGADYITGEVIRVDGGLAM